MGQGGSAPTEEGEETSTTTKTWYYELLEVEKDATQDQIDKAYKKAALKYHPDKNRDKDTTPLFQACQEAYSVLSDPHERQWYDDHREQILKGVDPEKAKEEHYSYLTPNDLIAFVDPSWYPGGFEPGVTNNYYQVYRELFQKIDKEEELEEHVGKEHPEAPNFGDAGTYIEDILAFYRYWEVFSTLKEFPYADQFDTSKATVGRERRFMQTENKKERAKEKKKFNQTVRDVLEFVRKRDPRYQHWKKSVEDEKQRKKNAEAEKKRKAAEEHQKRLEAYREEMRKHHEELDEQAEEEIVYEHKISCEICKKDFKTEGAFKTHCNSKKHKQKLDKFKKVVDKDIEIKDDEELMEKERQFREEEEEESKKAKQEIQNQYVEEELEKQRKKLKKKAKKDAEKELDNLPEEAEEDAEGEESESEEEVYVSRAKQKKMQKNNKGKKQMQEPEPKEEKKAPDTKNKKKKKKQNYANQKKTMI